ncbi:hypothetical protein GIB67_000724 [Kingdonia uniflora]|uniref:Ataxin-10 domain-containing protein n=1 Tax=Kingdonia uniflora TaxID=39325 RepID=A0A7J7NDQ6_9MAGN|nr:hypothetical protein GIB67_000724 [Kingdonia uniflora]
MDTPYSLLLSSTNTSALDEALESLLKSSKTSTTRSEIDTLIPLLLQLTESLSNTASSTRPLLISTIQVIRNLCAGEMVNQNSFIKQNWVEIFAASLDFERNSDYGVLRIWLQLLGNVCLAGVDHQRVVWGLLFPNLFSEITKVPSSEICDPLCMILYTCCNGNSMRVGELCGAEGLPIIAEIVTTASTAGFGEEWFKWLIAEICFKDSNFQVLFNKLKSDSKDTHFTAEQAFVLGVLSEILNQQLDQVFVPNDFVLCVFGILKAAIEVVDFFLRGKSGLPTGSPAIDVVGFSITILRDICAQDGKIVTKFEVSTDVVDSLMSAGFLDLLLDMLRDLEPPELIRKSISQGADQERPSTSYLLKVCPYKGFRRDIVAVLANCMYHRRHVQDEIRKKNGIILLLQQCVVDEDNPFLREWGLWSVRNLLEGNEENQQEVTELRLQGSVNVPELSRLGLRVEVDQRTQRPKLVNDS